MASMKKEKTGQVLSNRMQKTVVVRVESHRHHPLYKKTIRNITKYKVHDEKNECGVGDTVKIVETRPLSKEKRWRISEILVKAATIDVKPEEIEPKQVSEEKQPEAIAEQPAGAAAETKQD
jgi:small subunit ribosomal protein S17